MSFGIGLLFFISAGILGMWLDLTGRAKRPSYFFALGALSMMPLFILALVRLLP
jgi:hypothetical protein